MNTRTGSLIGMILAAALMRILPHPWNFTPITAMALFSGAQFRTRWAAFAVPLMAMLLSDLVLGFYPSIFVTYLCFAGIVAIGMTLRQSKSTGRVAATAAGSSILFFAVSNFGVWLFDGMYPHTAAGLSACFTAALPFYQGTLLGDAFYTALLFGALRFAEIRFPSLQRASSI